MSRVVMRGLATAIRRITRSSAGVVFFGAPALGASRNDADVSYFTIAPWTAVLDIPS